MSLYTTPLQFGYFFGCLFAFLFWVRGRREERLSDTMLGWVLFLLVMEIQDYTFGFAGINVLWEELNGFPRYPHLLFGPAVYFYLKSQINHQFHFRRKDLLHLIPWSFHFCFNLIIFLQGKYAVQQWQASSAYLLVDYLTTIIVLASYGFYFWKSLLMYRQYRSWTEHQFSDTDAVSLIWYRNFLYLMIFSITFKWLWFLIDLLMELDFYQDWWWNLATAGIIIYIAIEGYAQRQFPQLSFTEIATPAKPPRQITADLDVALWQQKLSAFMFSEKPYLEPELCLADLARKLSITPPLLSQIINAAFEKNFNDFINMYRVEDFKNHLEDKAFEHYTLLGIALSCGFNSKATFNRAFKKQTGQSPSEYAANSKSKT